MYTVIMNDGDYRYINARNNKEALLTFHLMFSEEEIKEKEIELLDIYGNIVKEVTT